MSHAQGDNKSRRGETVVTGLFGACCQKVLRPFAEATWSVEWLQGCTESWLAEMVPAVDSLFTQAQTNEPNRWWIHPMYATALGFQNRINCTLTNKISSCLSSQCTIPACYWIAKKRVFDHKFFHFEERRKTYFTHPLIPCGSPRIYGSAGERTAEGVSKWTSEKVRWEATAAVLKDKWGSVGGPLTGCAALQKGGELKGKERQRRPLASRDPNPVPLSCPPLSLHVLPETSLWRGHYHRGAPPHSFSRTSLNKGTFSRRGHGSMRAYWPRPQQTRVVIIRKDGRSVRLK